MDTVEGQAPVNAKGDKPVTHGRVLPGPHRQPKARGWGRTGEGRASHRLCGEDLLFPS